MSYYNNSTGGGFVSEEEEVLRVHLHAGGNSDISLHRFVNSMNLASRSDGMGVGGAEEYQNHQNHNHNSIPARGSNSYHNHHQSNRRPLPPLNPLNLINNFSSNSSPQLFQQGNQQQNQQNQQQPQDSPFLRRLGEFRRSSAEFSIANFRQASQTFSLGGGGSGVAVQGEFEDVVGVGVESLEGEGGVDEPVVKASSSSESQALYGGEVTVKELKPEYARWFFKYEQDRNWTAFTGYDSIRMEQRYRAFMLEREESSTTSLNLDGHCISDGSSYYDPSSSSSGYPYNQSNLPFAPNHTHTHQPPYFVTPTTTTHYNYPNDYPNNHTPIDYPTQNQNHSYPIIDPPTFNHYPQNYPLAPPTLDYSTTTTLDYSGHSQSYAPTPLNLSPYQSHTHSHAHSPINQCTATTDNISSNTSRFLEPLGGPSGQGSPYGGSSSPRVSPAPGARGEDAESNENVIIVRGGLYEADLESWNCVATYWPGDKCQITRGTWFYDGTWQPLSVEHAEKLEEEHLGQFAGVSLAIYEGSGQPPDSPTKKNRPVMHRVSFCEFHVDWTSPTEIHLFSKAASYKFMRSVGQRLGFQTWGHRLCRGYYKPASIVDRPSEISHLVFVVHGIGQKMDTGRIVRNCASFRETVTSLKEKFFPHLNETKQRAEFFPVEWRSAAKLDGDVVDAITPHKLLSLRQLLNATAMDIMYYTSPLYRTEIQNALRNELNRIYSNFVKRNPDFSSRGGKVSVIAHSLGAVITYDIITGYMPQYNAPDPPLGGVTNGVENPYKVSEVPGLLFQLEHFFCLGSPLSVFLALRWREPHNPDYRAYILPKLLCKRIYNVFYSTDPVAYRLEPLLNKHYVHIAPLAVYAYGSLNRPKYDEMPRERINKEIPFRSPPEPTFPPQGPSPESAKSTPQRIINNLKSPPTPTKEGGAWGWGTLMKYLNRGENAPLEGELASELISPDSPSRGQESRANSTPEDSPNELSNDLEYRMDYVLKESNFSSTYLAALTSHTSYWSSPDTAFFVLSHLYGNLLEESPPPSQLP